MTRTGVSWLGLRTRTLRVPDSPISTSPKSTAGVASSTVVASTLAVRDSTTSCTYPVAAPANWTVSPPASSREPSGVTRTASE
ncbi:MAG: hypothetical protein ACYTDU_20055 [Planctomycetota bacterium]